MLTLPQRPGFTLPELLVVLAILSVVLAATAMIGARQQRLHASLHGALIQSSQLQQATDLLPVELQSIDPVAGDIPGGEARDTALQFRGTIVHSIVCDTAAGALWLAPRDTDPPLTWQLARPEPGDTAWLLGPDAARRWSPLPITSVTDGPATCRIGGNELAGDGYRALRVGIAVPPHGIGIGTPIRVTRPARYSLYRSADARWYLGLRQWNPAQARFNAIQPVSGPYRPRAEAGPVFVYRDSEGAPIPMVGSDTRRVAAIEVRLQPLPRSTTRSAITTSLRGGVIVALRNARP
jgi:prepilin-type N-terminal cleavage/methylation domain-containing protein